MSGGLSRLARYRAILEKDKKFDGILYFAVKNTGRYCRPSCSLPRPSRATFVFFDTPGEAEEQGYQTCKYCHPSRLKNNVSAKILASINAGAINDKGVHGVADSLHISERHLRRLVQNRTGSSPRQLNNSLRLKRAKRLVTQTDLQITDIAFCADFSSLRQFNDAFRQAFKISPRQMRKGAPRAQVKKSRRLIITPLKLSYDALLQGSLYINTKQGGL